MVALHFTDMAALRRSVEIDGILHAASDEEIEAAQNAYLVDGMPFIFGSDLSYDHNLNHFLRSCPTMGVGHGCHDHILAQQIQARAMFRWQEERRALRADVLPLRRPRAAETG